MVDIREDLDPERDKIIHQLILESYSRFISVERRNLLLISAIILISVITGVTPEGVSAAGMAFDILTPTTYYLVLCFLIVYFGAADLPGYFRTS
jgi:hypothetical protein